MVDSTLLSPILRSIDEKSANGEFANINYKRDARISEFIPPFVNEDYSGLSLTTDLVIYKELVRESDTSSDFENIERWFPENSIKVPLVVISVSNHRPSDDFPGPNFLANTHSIDEYTDTFRDVILTVDMAQQPTTFTGEFKGYSRHGNLISLRGSNILDDDYQEQIVEPIIEHLESTSDEELRESFSVERIVEEFEPDVFHFNEVNHAYKSDRYEILVILLAVFFESYSYDMLDHWFSGMKENDHAGDFYKEWRFAEMLRACRYFGLLNDSDYAIINKVRRARNTYAHKFEEYSNTRTEIEREGKIDEAVQLYERLIGIDQSITY